MLQVLQHQTFLFATIVDVKFYLMAMVHVTLNHAYVNV